MSNLSRVIARVLKALEGNGIPVTSTGGCDMGPVKAFRQSDWCICARRYSIDPQADGRKFGYVKMPEYRWGVLLAPKDEKRVMVNFGASIRAKPAWQDVPGEHRASAAPPRWLSRVTPSLPLWSSSAISASHRTLAL